MHITFAPKGILQIDDARIIYRNLNGEPSKFNKKGDRNFAIIIPNQEQANALIEDGWNVKIKDPREEGDDPFIFLPVKVKFNDIGPNIYIVSGQSRNRLSEDSVGVLDDIDIIQVDLDIRPYDWEVNGDTGRAAYLQSMEVIQRIDRFEARHEADRHSAE